MAITIPRSTPVRKLLSGSIVSADLIHLVGKAVGMREETGMSTVCAAGIGVQASRERFAGITSGTANFQQGLAATCKDQRYKGDRSLLEDFGWAHDPVLSEEGRVMPAEMAHDAFPKEVTPSTGKGALGKWRAPNRNTYWTQCQGKGENLNGCRAGGITMHPRGVCRRVLKPRDVWEDPSGKCCCRQPDSGNPTVRDERWALRKRGLRESD